MEGAKVEMEGEGKNYKGSMYILKAVPALFEFGLTCPRVEAIVGAEIVAADVEECALLAMQSNPPQSKRISYCQDMGGGTKAMEPEQSKGTEQPPLISIRLGNHLLYKGRPCGGLYIPLEVVWQVAQRLSQSYAPGKETHSLYTEDSEAQPQSIGVTIDEGHTEKTVHIEFPPSKIDLSAHPIEYRQ